MRSATPAHSMPCDGGTDVRPVSYPTLPRNVVFAVPRVHSMPSPVSYRVLNSMTLLTLRPDVELPDASPASPVTRMPAPPDMLWIRLWSNRLSWLRSERMPMQKLRISRLVMRTLPESTTARPGFETVRTFGPKPLVNPGQNETSSPLMKFEPSIATAGPAALARRLCAPSITTGPTIGGRGKFSLMTWGATPRAGIRIVLPPVLGFALLCMIALRSVPRPLSP